jgi:hypothetical protein
MVNRAGERATASCLELSCPACVHRLARRRARAIGLARPERAILLTHVGDTWQEIRPALHRLRKIIRQKGHRWQDEVHIEPFPSGNGNHAHMWQWGDRIREDELSCFAERAGLGRFVSVQRRRLPAG